MTCTSNSSLIIVFPVLDNAWISVQSYFQLSPWIQSTSPIHEIHYTLFANSPWRVSVVPTVCKPHALVYVEITNFFTKPIIMWKWLLTGTTPWLICQSMVNILSWIPTEQTMLRKQKDVQTSWIFAETITNISLVQDLPHNTKFWGDKILAISLDIRIWWIIFWWMLLS